MKYVVFYYENERKNKYFSTIIHAGSRSESMRTFARRHKDDDVTAVAAVTEGEIFDASAELVDP